MLTSFAMATETPDYKVLVPDGKFEVRDYPALTLVRTASGDGDFMRLDGTLGGKIVADPGGWLDAYWMGRYYGFITAPQTDDKSLATVPERGLQLGAEPYQSPSRPKLSHEQ